MSSSSAVPVTPPTIHHFFGVAPRALQGGDGSLILTRSSSNRVIIIAGVIAVLAAVALFVQGCLRTGEWRPAILLAAVLLAVWLPWSVVSVTFDRTEGRMRLRRSFYPLRRVRDRSLGDLRAVLVVTFKRMPFGHVRLVFGESNPRTVELAAFWQPAHALRVASKLSAFLGAPLEEAIYPPKRGGGTPGESK